jgi:hypothetical protein
MTALTRPQQAWVDALRSGEYKQTTRVLCRLDGNGKPVGYCCLGVACDLAIKAGLNVIVGDGTHVDDDSDETINARYYESQSAALPELVRDWLGLQDKSGSFDDDNDLDDFKDARCLAAEKCSRLCHERRPFWRRRRARVPCGAQRRVPVLVPPRGPAGLARSAQPGHGSHGSASATCHEPGIRH